MPSKNIVDFANQVKSYAMSNNEQKLTGAYNLLSPFDYPATQTSVGVKWTNNGDRTFSSSNTATADSWFTLVDNQKLGPTGTYLLRGCPAGGGLYKYFLRVRDVTAGVNYDEYGNGIQIDIDDTHYYNVVFVVIGGETAPTGLWKPMILTAMTNRELTDKITQNDTTVELNTGISRWTDNVVCKKDRVCVMTLSVSGTFTANTEISIGTIPAGFRPRATLFFPLSTTAGYGYAKIQNDGVIKVNNVSDNATYICVCGSWLES